MDQGVGPRKRPAIIWLNVITVLSASILIGVEVLGLAFAGGWAIADLFGLGEYGGYVLQTLFSAFGLVIVANFVRAARRVEPFTRA